MIEIYIYAALLVIGILILFRICDLSLYCPKKIRTMSIIIIIIMFLRYISMSIMFFSSKIQYLYLLKYTFFIDFIAIPIIAITVLYIFSRKDSVNFSYYFIVTIALAIVYGLIMYKCTCYVTSLDYCGYTITFTDDLIYWIYILINTFIMFLAICLLNRSSIDKVGIYIVIFSSLLSVIEMLTYVIGFSFMPDNIVGDSMWIICLMYGLKKISKVNIK